MDIHKMLREVARTYGVQYALAIQAAILVASECWDQSCNDEYGTFSAEAVEELASKLKVKKDR